MAPLIWKHLMESPCPEDFFSGLNHEDKHAIEKWRSKRAYMLQTRVQQEVQAKIEDEPSLVRDSTPFLRILVRSYDRSLLRAPPTPEDAAMLTVWSPSEEQCSLLREGTALRFENLSTRKKYDYRLQLSANARTLIAPCSHTPLPQKMISSLFAPRKFSPLVQIHALSRRLLHSKDKGGNANQSADYDVMGVILKVEETKQNVSIYLADRANLVVRVHCGSSMSLGDSIGLRSSVSRECTKCPRIVAFRDLSMRPFDTKDNCAVMEAKGVSTVRSQSAEPKTENLRQWADSIKGRGRLQQLAARLDAGLFTMQRPLATFVPVLGYIAGFTVQPPNQLRIQVDSGSKHLQEFAFPFRLLQEVTTPSNASNSMVSPKTEEEGVGSKLKLLGKFLRAKGVLYRFTVKRNSKPVTGNRQCEYEVCHFTAADLDAVCDVYQSMQPVS